jgi:hypothetical protein
MSHEWPIKEGLNCYLVSCLPHGLFPLQNNPHIKYVPHMLLFTFSLPLKSYYRNKILFHAFILVNVPFTFPWRLQKEHFHPFAIVSLWNVVP